MNLRRLWFSFAISRSFKAIWIPVNPGVKVDINFIYLYYIVQTNVIKTFSFTAKINLVLNEFLSLALWSCTWYRTINPYNLLKLRKYLISLIRA